VPDGVLFAFGKVIVVEAKLFALPRLWYQLRWLYGPLAKAAFPDAKVCELGIVASEIFLPLQTPEQPWLANDESDVTPNGWWLMRWK
jgi:hypothetical protein